MVRRILFFVIAACLAGAFALSSPQEEKSYTRLARLSYLEGHVSFQHSPDVDWSAASVNLPIEPGDRVYTGNEGRAEIEFDDGSVFRLAENTDVEILSLRQDLIQIRILLGLSTLNVRGDANFEINTPVAAFNAIREGIYRFDVVENGDTDAIVRKGELEAANNEFSRRLRSGDLLHLSPRDMGKPEISLYDRRDPWDEWNDRRNADLQVYGNGRYLPDDVYMGAPELDQYGRWVNVEVYGPAWVPYGVDPYLWSPYSIGRWCYRPFYGWTWVSYEPWGWLPYHYGRWYRNAIYGWCWLPGPSFAFNFWSPGLVTFYSGHGRVSWCPLGPGDYYDVNKYHYNHGIYSHQIAQLRKLNTRPQGDLFNRDVTGAFRTAQLEQFRDGSFDGRGQNTRWGDVGRPGSQETLVKDRLEINPTSKSFSAATDRVAVRPGMTRSLPAIVRSVPTRDSGDGEQFTRITNPATRTLTSGSVRRAEPGADSGTGSGTTGRVIQVPQNPSAVSPRNSGDSLTNGPRGTGSRTQRGENANTTGRSAQPARPENPAPSSRQNSNPQNPSRWRIERIPESPSPRQATPQSGPRSEFRQQTQNSAARPRIGRWSDSSGNYIAPPPAVSNRTFTVPRFEGGARWAEPSPGPARSFREENAPASVPPRSDNMGRWSGSSPAIEGPRDSGKTSTFRSPRQSNPSFGRSGGNRLSAPSSQSFGNRSAGRSAPAGNAGRRR